MDLPLIFDKNFRFIHILFFLLLYFTLYNRKGFVRMREEKFFLHFFR